MTLIRKYKSDKIEKKREIKPYKVYDTSDAHKRNPYVNNIFHVSFYNIKQVWDCFSSISYCANPDYKPNEIFTQNKTRLFIYLFTQASILIELSQLYTLFLKLYSEPLSDDKNLQDMI